MSEKIKHFYESEYHFDEDYERGVPQKRLHRFLDPLQINKSGLYLDVGCGVGHSLKYALDREAKVYGLDLSEKALRYAKQVTENKAGVICGDGQFLPFDSQSFEFVSALGVIEHFPDTFQGLKEIHRVLKSGGKAIIVVPNSFGFLYKWGIFKGTEQEQELMLTCREWKEMISKANLKVIKIGRDPGPPIFKNWKPFKIIQRILLKTTLILPINAAYEFVFLCEK